MVQAQLGDDGTIQPRFIEKEYRDKRLKMMIVAQ